MKPITIRECDQPGARIVAYLCPTCKSYYRRKRDAAACKERTSSTKGMRRNFNGKV